MKKIRLIKSKNAFLLGLILILCYGCERDISDEAVPATFPTIGDIFTDTPIGLTEEFFNSFDPAAGANVNGFGTDNAEAYEGSTSIRIDVPAPNDPDAISQIKPLVSVYPSLTALIFILSLDLEISRPLFADVFITSVFTANSASISPDINLFILLLALVIRSNNDVESA